jgi:RNA polymerase sigma-70 factor (ECF subfamily)
MNLSATLPRPAPGLWLGPGPGMRAAAEQIDGDRDQELISALQRGDEAGVKGLYERFGGTVLGYLISRLGDRAAAEDVLQLTFTDLWRRSADYDPERSSLFSWVMLVARSRATDQLRRSLPEPHEPGRTVELIDSKGEHESNDELIERWRVAELLRRVPAEEERIMRMRFYEGLSQREIAERTGAPLGTVKMRMVKALERMRTLIDEEQL